MNTTELGRRIERQPLPRLETLLRWMDAIDLNEDMRSLLEESIEELRDVALGLMSADRDRSASIVPDGTLWQDTAVNAPLGFLADGITGAMFVTQEMIQARNVLDCYDEDGDDYIDEGERQGSDDLEAPPDSREDVLRTSSGMEDESAMPDGVIERELELRAGYADAERGAGSADACADEQADYREVDMDPWAADELIEEGMRVADESAGDLEEGCEAFYAASDAEFSDDASAPVPVEAGECNPASMAGTNLERHPGPSASLEPPPGSPPGNEADDNDVRLPSVDEEAWDEVLDAIGGPQEGFANWPHPHPAPRQDSFEYLEDEEEMSPCEAWQTPSALDLMKTLENCLPTDLDASDFTGRVRASTRHADQG